MRIVPGMTHDDTAEHGAEPAAEAQRKTPPRGPAPLSLAHRRRVLCALVETAAGDGPHAIAAQQASVELSLSAEKEARLADALACLETDAAEGDG